MISRLIIAFALFWSSYVFAGGIVPPVSSKWVMSGNPGITFSSPDEVCVAAHGPSAESKMSPVMVSEDEYRCVRSTDGLKGAIAARSGQVCPEYSEEVSGKCFCNVDRDVAGNACIKKNPCADPVNEHEEGGACVPNDCKPNETRVNGLCVKEPDCPQGETRVNGVCKKANCEAGKEGPMYHVTSKTAFSTCIGGCIVVGGSGFLEAKKDGKVVDLVAFTVYTGGTCNTPPTPPTDKPGTPGGPNDGNGGNTNDGGGTGGGGSGGGTGGGTGGGSGGGSGGNNNNSNNSSSNGGTNNPDDPKPADTTKPPTSKPGSQGGLSGNGIPGEKGPDDKIICPSTHYVGTDGKCWLINPQPTPPDKDGACPSGFVKAGTSCVPYQPPDKEKDKPFCETNKDLDVCKKGTFGGACAAGFACEGDAIQCAMAKEQHMRNCKLFDDPPDPLFKSAVDGSDGKGADKMKENALQVSVGNFDSTGFGWGSTCPADPVIPLGFAKGGGDFVIPFSKVCGPLGILSAAGVGVTLLASLLWVLGGRKTEGS